MFILSTLSDVIQIEPTDFRKPSAQALEDNINHKYANKIIQQVGLCICFYDLLSASDGLIGNLDGLVNVNVEFRIIVFRPFKGEILEGKIVDSFPTGIRINLDFFEDITVPGPSNLFEDSHFDAAESVWVWTNDGTPYYFDKGERVRLRVEEEIWHDQAPDDRIDDGGVGGVKVEDGGGSEEKRPRKSAWRIVGSMQQGGLGLVTWW